MTTHNKRGPKAALSKIEELLSEKSKITDRLERERGSLMEKIKELEIVSNSRLEEIDRDLESLKGSFAWKIEQYMSDGICRTTGEVANAMGLTPAAAAHHLASLMKSGMMRGQRGKEFTWMYFQA